MISLVHLLFIYHCTQAYGEQLRRVNIIEHVRHTATVSQSSLYPKGNKVKQENYNASKAIDGQNCTDLERKCCSVTDEMTRQTSWWKIDLTDKFTVNTVEIYGRTFEKRSHKDNSQLEHAKIYAGNNSMTSSSELGRTGTIEVYTIPDITNTTHFEHNLTNPVTAQYFYVKISKKILTICEFILYWNETDCNIGQFGQRCQNKCHCADKKKCEILTGKCQSQNCSPGWTGPACNINCSHGMFGNGCKEECHCFENTSCNNENGSCEIGYCEQGWQGQSCNEECHDNSFGMNCSKPCHCYNSKCGPIYECNYGTFGQNCSQRCSCEGASCDHVNGTCSQGKCESGWTGLACNINNRYIKGKSDQTSSGSVIGGIVGGMVLLVLGAIAVFIIFKRWKSLERENTDKNVQFSELVSTAETTQIPKAATKEEGGKEEKQNESEKVTEEVHDDYYTFGDQYMKVQIHELWDYIHKKMENQCEGFEKEFQSLPKGLIKSCKTATIDSNREKNRYKNMVAYDDTRVILEGTDEAIDSTQTNYINASYIDGYEKVKKFVASQGPTKQMINDFWKMVWQLKADKIVMLTDVVELGKVKCLQYWPDENEEESQYGNIFVKVLETEKYLDYNIRCLEARKNGECPRRIRQFHFKSWPDKDVPDSTWCLLSFWRVVDTDAASSAGPIVVHCSAGIGRTGTFIALDNIVNQAKHEGCIRPYQIVDTLRRQRVNMVQTKEQYIYLHEAVADALLFGTHYIWAKQFEEMYKYMVEKEQDTIKTRLQIQFELIEKCMTHSKQDDDDSSTGYSNFQTILSESMPLSKVCEIVAPYPFY